MWGGTGLQVSMLASMDELPDHVQQWMIEEGYKVFLLFLVLCIAREKV